MLPSAHQAPDYSTKRPVRVSSAESRNLAVSAWFPEDASRGIDSHAPTQSILSATRIPLIHRPVKGRVAPDLISTRSGQQETPRYRGVWWMGVDSNHRKLRWQIYSLLPLATREPIRAYPLQAAKVILSQAAHGCQGSGTDYARECWGFPGHGCAAQAGKAAPVPAASIPIRFAASSGFPLPGFCSHLRISATTLHASMRLSGSSSG